jgi:hypothetical protein
MLHRKSNVKINFGIRLSTRSLNSSRMMMRRRQRLNLKNRSVNKKKLKRERSKRLRVSWLSLPFLADTDTRCVRLISRPRKSWLGHLEQSVQRLPQLTFLLTDTIVFLEGTLSSPRHLLVVIENVIAKLSISGTTAEVALVQSNLIRKTRKSSKRWRPSTMLDPACSRMISFLFEMSCHLL